LEYYLEDHKTDHKSERKNNERCKNEEGVWRRLESRNALLEKMIVREYVVVIEEPILQFQQIL